MSLTAPKLLIKALVDTGSGTRNTILMVRSEDGVTEIAPDTIFAGANGYGSDANLLLYAEGDQPHITEADPTVWLNDPDEMLIASQYFDTVLYQGSVESRRYHYDRVYIMYRNLPVQDDPEVLDAAVISAKITATGLTDIKGAAIIRDIGASAQLPWCAFKNFVFFLDLGGALKMVNLDTGNTITMRPEFLEVSGFNTSTRVSMFVTENTNGSPQWLLFGVRATDGSGANGFYSSLAAPPTIPDLQMLPVWSSKGLQIPKFAQAGKQLMLADNTGAEVVRRVADIWAGNPDTWTIGDVVAPPGSTILAAFGSPTATAIAYSDEPEPPGDCFWTDVVGASQDCGEGPEPPPGFTFVSMGYTPRAASPIDDKRCVLVNDFSMFVFDFSGAGDPLVGSINFGTTTKSAYFVGGFFYWFGVDYSSNPDGELQCVMLPENEVIGVFEVYSGPRTNINAATGFGAGYSVTGALPDPDSVAGLLLLRDNNTQATKLFSTTAGSGADSWTQLASAPNALSDIRLSYDPQLGAPLLTANNGAPGDLLVWWAYKVTAGGWTLMQEATNGNVGYSSVVNWWSAVGKFVGIVNDTMSVINSDGTTSPFAGGVGANALFPYDGTRAFKAPSHNCENIDIFGTMHDSAGAVVETTTANFKYVGCQCYLAMPAAKLIIGRMPNQCL